MIKSREAVRERKKAILQYASDTRKFEIERFWQRSLFFWGFIGAALVAYGTLSKEARPLPGTMISGFGLIASFAWTL